MKQLPNDIKTCHGFPQFEGLDMEERDGAKTDDSENPGYIDLDVALKSIELELKRAELRQADSALRRIGITGTEVTLLVAILSLLGSSLAILLQSRAEAEKDRLQSERRMEQELVLGALQAGDSEAVVDRLRFLIDAQYIRDDSGHIKSLILSGRYGDIATPIDPSISFAVYTADIPKLVQYISRLGKLETPIQLAPGNLRSASFIQKDGKYLVMHYNKSEMEDLVIDGNPNWAIVTVLAHEIGHAALGHLTFPRCFSIEDDGGNSPCKTQKQLELEADRFAGATLRQMGATIEEASSAYERLEGYQIIVPDESGDNLIATYQERLDAIQLGWRSGRAR